MDYRTWYYRRYATTVRGQRASFDPEYARAVAPVFRETVGGALPADPDARIADVGCGPGYLLRYLAGLGYRRLEGVDDSPEQVAVARSVFGQVRRMSALRFLRASRSRYDAILLVNVAEHLRKGELVELLGAAYRALAPGGTLLLTFPNAASPLFGSVFYADFTHETCLEPNVAGAVLRLAGFEGIRCRELRPPAWPLLPWVRRQLWKVLRLGIMFRYLVETGSRQGGVYTRVFAVTARKPFADRE